MNCRKASYKITQYVTETITETRFGVLYGILCVATNSLQMLSEGAASSRTHTHQV
jgi:hypothetical protein